MMATVTITYEEVRRRKLEENKKKLEELKLGHLSIALRDAASPKTSPAKQMKRKAPSLPEELLFRRRSGRIANLPEPSYKESELIAKVWFDAGVGKDLLYYARAYSIKKAEELQLQLDQKHPSFVKPMLQSHVTGGFWLGFPKYFCSSYLPNRDIWLTLVDEEEEESKSLYLALKSGLSAGWRGFAMAHEIVDGDAVLFHLINPTTFKVYMIRASGYNSS